MKVMWLLMGISSLFILVLLDMGYAQTVAPHTTTPQTKGRSAQSRKQNLMKLKTIRQKKEVQGIDMKALANPEAAKGLQWQKVVVGQQQLSGARVMGLSDNSVWQRLGLNQGDVVFRVAGEEISSPDALSKAANKIFSSSPRNESVDFLILRKDQVFLIDYKLHW